MKRKEPDTLTPAERLAISRKVPPKIKLFLAADRPLPEPV